MATYLSLVSFLLLTFLLASTPLSSARDIPGEISLILEPEESYYIVKKKPAVIICQARNAADIIFSCMGTQIPPSSVELEDVSDIDPSLIQAKIEVTRADVQNFETSGTPFWCECSAVDVNDQIVATSRRTTVTEAYLKYKFGMNPVSTTASEGENVEFACVAPEGDPVPEIVWRKDKKRVDVENSVRHLITDKGSLVIESVTQDDAGKYECVAKNFAGRRESDEAVLTVKVLAEAAEAAEEHVEPASSKARVARQSQKAYFTTEPEASYHVTPDEPLLIDCGVTAADILTYRCNGERMDRERQTTNQGMDNAGNRVIQSQLSISYQDVQDFLARANDDRQYQCQCVAWYQDSSNPRGWGHITTSRDVGIVHLAYLERTFQTEPSDVVAGLNTDATIVCEPPKGQPRPYVVWFKDRSRLDPRQDTKYSVNDRGHLIIHNVQYEDAGSFNCLAENKVDSVQSRLGRLTVTAEAPPTTTAAPREEGDEYIPRFPEVIPSTPLFLRDYEPQNTLGRDGTKTMICAVVSADQMTVDCGGARLAPEEYQLHTEVDARTGKRLLSATAVITENRLAENPEDFFCQCTAWYINQDQGWAKITSARGYIREAAGAYIDDEFEFPPEDLEILFGDSAEFACEPPAGDPQPRVYWLKDGQRIDPAADPNYVIFNGPLIVEYVRVMDEGTYTCVAENEAGTRFSDPVRLTVLGKPTTLPDVRSTAAREATTTTGYGDYDSSTFILTEPMFSVEPLEMNYIVKDQPVTLSCTVVGAKTLLFACNGEVLRESATTGFHTVDPVSQHSIRENYLTVTQTQVEEYTGSEPYTCVCKAYYQKEGAGPQDLSVVESQPAVIQIAYLRNRFGQEPVDTEVAYLDVLELPCEAPNGVPEPEVSWLKDGHRITEDERIQVLEDGTLVIYEFADDDVGQYTCVAENLVKRRTSETVMVSLADDDSISSETKPTAEPKPEVGVVEPTDSGVFVPVQPAGTPYISKDLHTVYYLIKNKPVTMLCEAHAVNSITFSCGMEDVEDVKVVEKMEEIMREDGQIEMQTVISAEISVTKADAERHGSDYWCQCYAHYTVPGMADQQFLASEKGYVEMAYLKKNFQKEPENQKVMEGDFLSIMCQPPIGNPEPKVMWTKDGENVEALSITPDGALIFPEARLEHTGEYVCVAENDAGSRSSPPILVEVQARDDSMEVQPETDAEETGGEPEEGVVEPQPEEGVVEPQPDEGGVEPQPEEGIVEPWPEEGVVELQPEEGRVEPQPEVGVVEPTAEGELEGEPDVEPTGETHEEQGGGEAEWEIDEHYDGYDGDEDEDEENVFEGTSEESEEENMLEGEDGYSDKNACTQMLTTCLGLLPQNVDHMAYCKAVESFVACEASFTKTCSAVISEESMNAVKMAKMHALNKCKEDPSCPKLEDCKMIYSNSPDKTMDSTGLPVRDFCEDVNSFLRCVDQTLVDCNVTMAPPEDDVRTSLFEVGDWFGQYCNRMILGSNDLVNCDQMVSCDLRIGQVAANNASYWCRLMNTLVECTASAVNTCGLDELRNDLEDLHSQATHESCSDAEMEGSWPEGHPEVHPESEGEPEPTGEGEPEPEDGDDDDDDGDDIENMEGDTEASKEDPENGSSVLGTSTLLAIFSQLLVAAILSRR